MIPFPNLTLYGISRGLQKPFSGLEDMLHFNSSSPGGGGAGDEWNVSREELDAFLRFLDAADAQHTNVTSFFDTYFSAARFAVETCVAVLAMLFNVTALVLVRLSDTRHQPVLIQNNSPYNALFINLAVSNILSCLLSWFGNNVIYLFEADLYYHLLQGTDICRLFLYLQAMVFLASGFGVVSTLTMLGFTTVQYFAICRPLHHLSIIRRRRVLLYIALSWAVTMLLCCAPVAVMCGALARWRCTEAMLEHVLAVTVAGANVCIGAVAAVYLSIIAVCARVFAEIRLLQRRLSQLRFQQHVHSQERAFYTTLILLLTFTLFIAPYSSVFLYTLNSAATANSPVHNNALIYYMNILPYLKFLTDPIIYGLRMREVRGTLMRAAWRLGCERCPCFKCEVLPPTPSSTVALHHFTSLSHGLGIESREMLKDVNSRDRDRVAELVLPALYRSHHVTARM